ncbi:hypothetical protein B0H13DRAFT_868569 [Mycena leptocephala]|nr:hypothetical protein B0H13DRAFT_868569 [Mycena leptocephala]
MLVAKFAPMAAFVMLCMMHATPAGAVCASGQLAVGTEFLQEFTGPNSSFNVFAGFLMANNCGIISENGATQDSNQMCHGDYDGGASVTCNSSHRYVVGTPSFTNTDE